MLKVVFLDRDGVINRKPKDHEYVVRLEDFVLNAGIIDLLRSYIGGGLKFIIITNQRGVAKGLLTENDLRYIHEKMLVTLREYGIEIFDIFYCPHNVGECSCRKPQPGLIMMAKEKHNIDLESSVLISDSSADIEMGVLAGIGKNIFVESDTLRVLKIFYGKN